MVKKKQSSNLVQVWGLQAKWSIDLLEFSYNGSMILRLRSNVLEQDGPKEMKISKKLLVLAMVLTEPATQKASARKGNPLAPT